MPYGRVFLFLILMILNHMVMTASHHPQEFLQKIHNTENEGEQIYQHFCSNCHAPSPVIPLGAPRLNTPEDWKRRLKQGMDKLILHTNEGINAMPPRGGCFECTDEQLKAAILYMLPKLKAKHRKN